MPDPPHRKAHEHPFKAPRQARRTTAAPRRSGRACRYAELCVTSNFTFLTGASHPDELMHQAADLGYEAIALTDHNSLAGIVRAHVAAKEAGIPLVVGCRLVFNEPDWLSLLVYPINRNGYGQLCRLLTIGKRRAAKGECCLFLKDLRERSADWLAVLLPPPSIGTMTPQVLHTLRDMFDDDRLSIALTRLYEPEEDRRGQHVQTVSKRFGIPPVVVEDVHYHVLERKPLQDVLTCIRHRCTLAEAGFRLFAGSERYLRVPEEIARRFADQSNALARTVQIAERARGFSLDELQYEYPTEPCPPGVSPMAHLKELVRQGAQERYTNGTPVKVRKILAHEFALIDELNYAPYFLTVHDIVAFARSRGILCQGRGAAANSAVCYCLGITAVDPDRVDLLFERFVSRERNEPPDIDIDFEHERREEVIQYIYKKYGRDRAALTAEVITYRRRSAVRDVGKVLGFSLDAASRIAKRVDQWEGNPFADTEAGDVPAQLEALGFDPDNVTVRLLIRLVRKLIGFPRHLSQHVGGFVITRRPLTELVPIENAAMPDRTVIEWDKDDIDAVGMLKIDVLGLGMLTCLRKGLELLRDHHDRVLTLADIPAEDETVYDMICRGDTLGVFQIESRAQMTMLPRLKPRCYYDLVIEVAIVRPGPIIGQMVHPYLRRRDGEEAIHYPSEIVREVLGRTLGVPLFQEQVMLLAVKAAGFTPGEAEHLRRAITAWTSKDKVVRYTTRFIDGMLANGYSREFANWCFHRMKGFSQYGFPESHAASFALLVYSSSWLKCHYPAVFAAALLNSQPLGFYAPAQIVRDARDHDVTVRGVDVNHSTWDCTLENGGTALRLGMRMVRGMKEKDARAISEAVEAHGPFATPAALWQASGISSSPLWALARADAFGSMNLDRQSALWTIPSLRGPTLPLIDQTDRASVPTALPPIPANEQIVRDYQTTGLSLKAHPMSFLREELAQRGIVTTAEVKNDKQSPFGKRVAVAGLVLFRQRPGTAKGVMFMTIEDETARLDLIVKPRVCDRFRSTAVFAKLVLVRGRVERRNSVVHVLAETFEDLDHMARPLHVTSRDFR